MDRWGDIYAGASVKKMIALYDYDAMELSPNVDMEATYNIYYFLMGLTPPHLTEIMENFVWY